MSEATHIISLGAGVQSTVMLLMADEGLIEPRPAAAVFADTHWEPAAVYERLDWLESVCSIPIHRLDTGGDLYADTWAGRGHDGRAFTDIPVFVDKDGKASISTRQCTQHYKINAIARHVRTLIGRKPGSSAPYPQAVQWLGISMDEALRMKESRRRWMPSRWPLIELRMRRADCQRWFKERYPDQTLVKSSCVGCPYHSNAQWLELYRQNPDDMERTIALDERLRSPDRPPTGLRPEYLHRSLRPLREVLEKLDRDDRAGRQLSLADGFLDEFEGHCGV